jgi:hypothetical protein
MGFRMRKSMKIAPGVRLSVSKSGVGASVGGMGGRYSVHSSGRRTTTVGSGIVPGVYYQSSKSGGSHQVHRAPLSSAATTSRVKFADLTKAGPQTPATIERRMPETVSFTRRTFALRALGVMAFVAAGCSGKNEPVTQAGPKRLRGPFLQVQAGAGAERRPGQGRVARLRARGAARGEAAV